MRIAYALRQHEQWYKGEGIYGDGANFHWDYYNCFVIQPMQLDVTETAQACGGLRDPLGWLLPLIRQRAVRHAAVQERLIAPDGSLIGRDFSEFSHRLHRPFTCRWDRAGRANGTIVR